VVPQCSIKPLPLGRTQGKYVAPYLESFVLPLECPRLRKKLNIEALNLAITRLRAVCLWWSNKMSKSNNKQVLLMPTFYALSRDRN